MNRNLIVLMLILFVMACNNVKRNENPDNAKTEVNKGTTESNNETTDSVTTQSGGNNNH